MVCAWLWVNCRLLPVLHERWRHSHAEGGSAHPARTPLPHPPATPHPHPRSTFDPLLHSTSFFHSHFTSSLSSWLCPFSLLTPLFLGTVSLYASLCLHFFLFHLLSWISWLSDLSLFFIFYPPTFLSYFGNSLLVINTYNPPSSDIFLVPEEPLPLNSQHRVLVLCPSFLCPRPPGLAGLTLMPQPLAWFPWSLLHILSVSLTYYVRHLVSPCLGLQLNFWVKKWLFLLYIL